MSETGLYKKISQVMQDVEYLSKDDRIKFKETDYKAISEEKVTSTLRISLIKNGLVIIPIEQQSGKVGNISTVNTKYKIVDIDTGHFEILASSGEGADTQDKGVGKAMTYAYKYMLLRTFAIPTGEDPDKISSAELDEKQREEVKKGNDDSTTSQEVGQREIDDSKKKTQQNQTSKSSQTNKNVSLISDAQVQYCDRLKKNKGISDEDFKRMIAEHGDGNESIKELSKKAASEFITFLTNYQAEPVMPDGFPF